ncbi:CLNS1A-like [Ictidomys tridecemlineatus]|uniref:Methylosome subunit pICln n=1 Tax=Ictidomys tridecemlineatus TaxID=43179 RepID=A0A287D9F7_ICTTR|nr:CLNS1A-like [Ictidomys tridecemlineatus]
MSFLKSFPPLGQDEGLRQQQPDTEAGLGIGALYIAESRLSWLDGSGLGFSLEYPTISLHSVSRDLNAYPREHLYVMALHPDPEDEDSDDYDGEEYDVEAHEQRQGGIPTFYTYEEGLSHLTAEGQATLERLEGILSQFVSSQCNMAGVGTEDSVRDYEDGMKIDTTPTVAEDADVDL